MSGDNFNTDHIDTVEVPVTPASQSIEVKLARVVFVLGILTAMFQGALSYLMVYPGVSANLRFIGNVMCAIFGAATASLSAANVFLIKLMKQGVVSKNVRVDSLPTSK